MNNDKRRQRGNEIEKVVFPLAENISVMPESYQQFIKTPKEQILSHQVEMVCGNRIKTVEFEPGYISKLNMYLNVVNDSLCQPEDNATIGLLLVKNKNKLVVEYSLTEFTNLIGISNWENEIVKSLPDNIKHNLPTIKEIEIAHKRNK